MISQTARSCSTKEISCGTCSVYSWWKRPSNVFLVSVCLSVCVGGVAGTYSSNVEAELSGSSELSWMDSEGWASSSTLRRWCFLPADSWPHPPLGTRICFFIFLSSPHCTISPNMATFVASEHKIDQTSTSPDVTNVTLPCLSWCQFWLVKHCWF